MTDDISQADMNMHGNAGIHAHGNDAFIIMGQSLVILEKFKLTSPMRTLYNTPI